MNTTVYLKDTLSKLESLYHEMQGRFEAPVLQDMGGAKRFRYRSLSESLACFLKGAKAISTLDAALVLLRAGHTQEIGALCRMVSDLHNEIHFLFAPQDGEEFSKAQLQFLEDFFQEEFDKPMNALGSTQKRASVHRG